MQVVITSRMQDFWKQKAENQPNQYKVTRTKDQLDYSQIIAISNLCLKHHQCVYQFPMLKRSSDYHFVSTAAISYNTVKTSARTHQVSMLNIESQSKGGDGGMQTATDSTTSVSREGWVLLKGESHKKSIITCISSFHVKFHLVIQ